MCAINDPDHPNDSYYVVATPGNVTFTDDNKTSDGFVQMLKSDGFTAYEGDGAASVSVKSNNEYNLQLGDETDKVAYDFLYTSTAGKDAATDKKWL